MTMKITLSITFFIILMVISVVLSDYFGDIALVIPMIGFVFLFIYFATLRCPHCNALVLFSFKPLTLEIPILSVLFKKKCPVCSKRLDEN